MSKKTGSTEVLRTVFDQAALDYDAVRPGYPQELIEDIISISSIPRGGRILEVGCGTGQATLPFARREYSMLCLDIGRQLAAIAAQKCCQYLQVKIQIISFEDWQAEENTFDLVMSATAFHWIPPEVGYPKVARVLKSSGYIALFTNYHPTPFTGFFESVQKVYQRIVPEWGNPNDAPPIEERIKSNEAYINGTGLFEKAQIKTYAWTRDYRTEEYIKLLNTYSPHLSLEENRRSLLYGEIAELIEKEFGGVVTRPYLSVLYIARKKIGS